MLTRVLCAALATSSLEYFVPLRLCRLWPPWSFQQIPCVGAPHIATSWIQHLSASSYSHLSPLTLLAISAQHRTFPAFPRTRLVPLLGQTASSHSKPDSTSLLQPAQRGTTARFSKLGRHEGQPWQLSPAVPWGTKWRTSFTPAATSWMEIPPQMVYEAERCV